MSVLLTGLRRYAISRFCERIFLMLLICLGDERSRTKDTFDLLLSRVFKGFHTELLLFLSKMCILYCLVLLNIILLLALFVSFIQIVQCTDIK